MSNQKIFDNKKIFNYTNYLLLNLNNIYQISNLIQEENKVLTYCETNEIKYWKYTEYLDIGEKLYNLRKETGIIDEVFPNDVIKLIDILNNACRNNFLITWTWDSVPKVLKDFDYGGSVKFIFFVPNNIIELDEVNELLVINDIYSKIFNGYIFVCLNK